MTVAFPVGGTEQSELLSVVVNNQPLGVFDTKTGGDALAKDIKHRPGGMGPELPYTSLPTYSTMTLSRVYQANRDHELVRSLIPLAGRVAASVTIQPLDAEGNAYGQARTASGWFLGVREPKIDSTSDAVQMYDIEMSVVAYA